MAPDPSSAQRRLGGVRADATIVATLVVTAALAVGAATLVTLTRAQLNRTMETAVTTRAEDLSRLAATGDLGSPIPSSRGFSAQLINEAGDVVASTSDIEGQGPITSTKSPPNAIATMTIANLDEGGPEDAADDEGPYLVAVTNADTADGPLRVVVAGSLSTVENASATLLPLLAGGIPLLAGVVAATTWVLLGRALRPVQAMADEADRITLTDLARRIPLPKARDEVRRLGETLNRMLGRLETAVGRQRRFVADASHELKSPVASLLTMTEVALKSPRAVPVEQLAADVSHEARRLALLVEDLLTLARSDEGRIDLEPTRFDLGELVSEEAGPYRQRAIDVDLSNVKALAVTLDRRRLGQVVRNLIDNAMRHAASQVWIETVREGKTAELIVADDGPGIPADDRERIFSRFVRLDDTRSRAEGGTGLGLAVVRAIVEAHRGTVSVIDDPRFSGAVVRVRLPIA